jgi:hypothetical protein
MELTDAEIGLTDADIGLPNGELSDAEIGLDVPVYNRPALEPLEVSGVTAMVPPVARGDLFFKPPTPPRVVKVDTSDVHPLLRPTVDPIAVTDPQNFAEGLINSVNQGMAGVSAPISAILGPLMVESIVPRAIATLTKAALAQQGVKSLMEVAGEATAPGVDISSGRAGELTGQAVLGGTMALPLVAKLASAMPSQRPPLVNTRPAGTPPIPQQPRLLQEPPIDVESSVVRGNTLPPASRFVKTPGRGYADMKQMTPVEQASFYQAMERTAARDAAEIAQRQTKPKYTAPVVVGEQPTSQAPALTAVQSVQGPRVETVGGQLPPGQRGRWFQEQQPVPTYPAPQRRRLIEGPRAEATPGQLPPDWRGAVLPQEPGPVGGASTGVIPGRPGGTFREMVAPIVTGTYPSAAAEQQAGKKYRAAERREQRPSGAQGGQQSQLVPRKQQQTQPSTENWQVSVQAPQQHPSGQTVPGYVQIDDLTGGQNRWSKSPETLRKEGVEVPDFSKLPQGKYSYAEAVKKVQPQRKGPPGIGVGMKKAVKKNRQAGSISLGAIQTLRDSAKLGLKNVAVEGKQLWNRLRNVIGANSAEVQALEATPGFKEFVEGGKRTPTEVAEWLEKNGPRVEVKTIQSGRPDIEGQRKRIQQHERNMISAQHVLETQGFEVTDVGLRYKETGDVLMSQGDTIYTYDKGNRLTKQTSFDQVENQTLRKFFEARQEYLKIAQNEEPGGFDPDVYRGIAPKDADQTVVLVRVPTKATTPEGPKHWNAQANQELHRGQHFGSEDVNVLSWARIQYEDVPGKGKVAHIIEVQSDWGQNVRELKQRHTEENLKDLVRSNNPGIVEGSPEWDESLALAKQQLTKDHPLLRDYNRLAIKAAIDEARANGAQYIAISDAETAMMSEGHDAAARDAHWDANKQDIIKELEQAGAVFRGEDNYGNLSFKDKGLESGFVMSPLGENSYSIPAERKGRYGLKSVELEINQEPGMRLNYDTLLPRIAEELTGAKGEVVDFGEHQRAFESVNHPEQRGLMGYGRPRENLIFRNPDGTPKTTATARLYPIAAAKQDFSLFGSDKVQKPTYTVPQQPGQAGLAKNLRKPGAMKQQGEAGSITLEPLKEAAATPVKAIRLYSEPIIERLARIGGAVSKVAAKEGRQIVSRTKALYGKLTPSLDPAKKAVGKPNTGGRWLRTLRKITPRAAINNFVGAFEGKVVVPQRFVSALQLVDTANTDIGALVPGFLPTHKIQQIWTAYGLDVIRRGKGKAWDAIAEGRAVANNVPKAEIEGWMRELKKALDAPGADVTHINKISQDFARYYPHVVTHIKPGNVWHEVLVADPFNYLEAAAQRTAHAVAFREVYKPGSGLLEATRKAIAQELPTDVYGDEFDKLMRALQGMPTDSYHAWWNAPDSPIGATARTLTQTVTLPIKAMVLSANAVTNLGETFIGGPAIFLGYRNVVRALARAGTLKQQLEYIGARNRAMYNMAWDPSSPARSLARITSNALRIGTGEQLLNEVQEFQGAGAAQVVVEDLIAGKLDKTDVEDLVAVMRAMKLGTETEIRSAIRTQDMEFLQGFVRRAASWLTGGNMAMAERSSLGANRLFNELFWFHSYPQMTLNQYRSVLGNWVDDAHGLVTKKRTWNQFKANSKLLAKMTGGKMLAGAIYIMLTTLVREWFDGVEVKKNEMVDQPALFAVDSFVASGVGPLYAAKKIFESSGDASMLQTAIANTVSPLSVGSEMFNAAVGAGRYDERSLFERLGMFVDSKTPALRSLKLGAALAGLSQEDTALIAARNGFYRWRRKEFMPTLVLRGVPKNDEEELDAQFRVQVKRAVEALDGGGDWKEELLKAAELKDEKAIQQSLLRHRILKTPKGAKLTEEQMERLTKRIGNDAVYQLELHDAMVREIAYAVVGKIPPEE